MAKDEEGGVYCPDCGTYHPVVDSIPTRPLRRAEVESIKESDNVVFCRALIWMSGDQSGMDTSDDVTEDIVLATEGAARVITLHQEQGWAVEIEEAPEETESAEDVAWDIYQNLSRLTDAVMEGK